MDVKNFIGGILLGSAIGVTIGLLLAPDKGEKTRESLYKGAHKLTEGVKGSVEDSIGALKSRFNSGVDELIHTGKDAISSPNDRVKI